MRTLLAPTLLSLLLASCTKTEQAPNATPASEAAPAPKASAAAASLDVPAHIEGNHFALDVTAPTCRSGEECALAIKLVTSAEFHVNKDYPYKFVAAPAPQITFLGKEQPTTFSKATGDFSEEGEKAATMTVRFKAAAPGKAKVTGTYKMSVCSDEQCQIEQLPLDVVVPVI